MAKIKPADLKDLDPELIQIPSTEAKNNFGAVLADVGEENKRFAVTRNNRPVAVILKYQQYVDLWRRANGEESGD